MQTTGPLGRTTRYRHDAWGRTVEVIDAKGGSKRLAWDEADRLMAYTDCSGQTTRYTYDGMGRPLTRIDAAGRSLTYHYDRAGRLIALDNENHARTHFRYDLRDQLTDEVGFDGRWQRYIYNAAGELTHVIEADPSKESVSIHSRAWRLTCMVVRVAPRHTSFNPQPRVAADVFPAPDSPTTAMFQSTAARGG